MPHVFLGVKTDERDKRFILKEQAFITASMIVAGEEFKERTKEEKRRRRQIRR